MTESSGFIRRGPLTHQGFAAPAIKVKPAVAGLRSVRVPAHVVVLMGLSAGAYAIAVAGVTGLQSRTESALAADLEGTEVLEPEAIGRFRLRLPPRLQLVQVLDGDLPVTKTVEQMIAKCGRKARPLDLRH